MWAYCWDEWCLSIKSVIVPHRPPAMSSKLLGFEILDVWLECTGTILVSSTREVGGQCRLDRLRVGWQWGFWVGWLCRLGRFRVGWLCRLGRFRVSWGCSGFGILISWVGPMPADGSKNFIDHSCLDIELKPLVVECKVSVLGQIYRWRYSKWVGPLR